MSEDADDSQKTEDPTPKKLDEARRKGQIPLSREVNNWIMLFAGTLVVMASGPSVLSQMTVYMRTYIEQAHKLPAMPGGFATVLGNPVMDIISILAVPFLLLMAAAFLGPFVQVGPLFAPDTIKVDVSKISPFQGFKRLFSLRSVVEFAKGILKLTVIGVVGYMMLQPYYGQLEHMVGIPIPMMMDELAMLVVRMMTGILTALLIIAMIDLVYQRLEFSKKMRMTKQELKDEYKQTEGDPHIRAKLRQLRQERARTRMMQAVPKADVVITNPTHFAVALKYDPDSMDAPVLVAKGADDVAMRIREVAKENDVMIVENPPLARVLFDTVDIDRVVPPEHYRAVAEVISYVFRLKGRLKPT